MSKKKIGVVVGLVAAAAVTAAVVWSYETGAFKGIGDNGDRVYVSKVSELLETSGVTQNRYSGVVEAQETWNLNLDGERTVKECFVSVGDTVEAGVALISYDTEELAGQLETAKLELEGVNNEIAAYNNEIAELSKQRDAAPEDSKFEFTTQIQSKQADIRQSEYSLKSKQADIDKLQSQIENSIVTSKIGGVVKSINPNGSSYGDSEAYMTILATGDYRVKGVVNEFNIGMISEGVSVVLRSRVDNELTWKGTVTKIDTENQISNNNEYNGSSDSSDNSTKYPFYIKLDSADGLMLGQHLYIELGDEDEEQEKKDGIWLPASYIVQEEDSAYVWADENGKIAKKQVTLGELDENNFEYEIKEGLKENDLITWPMENIYEGVRTVTDASEVDYESPMYNTEGDGEKNGEDGEMTDEAIPDNEIPEDVMTDDIEGGDTVEEIPEDADSVGSIRNVEESVGGI